MKEENILGLVERLLSDNQEREEALGSLAQEEDRIGEVLDSRQKQITVDVLNGIVEGIEDGSIEPRAIILSLLQNQDGEDYANCRRLCIGSMRGYTLMLGSLAVVLDDLMKCNDITVREIWQCLGYKLAPLDETYDEFEKAKNKELKRIKEESKND